MQAIVPGEGRQKRIERFRSHFSRRRFPPFSSFSGRVPMAEAAGRLRINQEALESILARCKAKGRESGSGGLELHYDFKAFPVWLEGGQIHGGVLSGSGFRAISEYLGLRSMVREGLLLPVSGAFVSNPAITSRPARQMEILDSFVLQRLEFLDTMPPRLALPGIGYGLQAPVREYGATFYSSADYLEPIVFAAKMESRAPLTQFSEIERVMGDAAKAQHSGQVSVSLGMRLWIMREIFANSDYRGAFCERNLKAMDKILSNRMVLKFFVDSYNTYTDPNMHASQCGFKGGLVSRRKVRESGGEGG